MVEKKEYRVNDIQQQTVNWIEIECFESDGTPLANVEFILFLPNGDQKSGKLDEQGYCKVDKVSPGECKLMLLGYDATLEV